MYSNSKISLDDETRNSLKLISTCGFKIGILTNGVVKAQKNKVRCLDLSDFIDVIVYARECGNEKPDTKAFEAISNKLEVNMQKCLFVGDHILNDVKGALDAGMQAIHLTKYCGNVESYPGVIQMRTLSEVVKSIQS
jgi:putative hydrolase of the HAD superfamily